MKGASHSPPPLSAVRPKTKDEYLKNGFGHIDEKQGLLAGTPVWASQKQIFTCNAPRFLDYILCCTGCVSLLQGCAGQLGQCLGVLGMLPGMLPYTLCCTGCVSLLQGCAGQELWAVSGGAGYCNWVYFSLVGVCRSGVMGSVWGCRVPCRVRSPRRVTARGCCGRCAGRTGAPTATSARPDAGRERTV